MNKAEEWKKIILSINDNSFFDLMRNYLGRIETPFNKQDLINRLINFFNSNQVQEKILEILDDNDASILTAIHFMLGPSDSELHEVFPDWSYLDLHNNIQNLEERFLIYKKTNSYYITPVFEEIFLEKVISPSLLIETKTVESAIDPQLWLNDSLMFALLSFIQKNRNLIKIDGSIKKRGITELENIFPTLFSGAIGLKRFELCTSVLTNLNLVFSYDGLICTDIDRWNKLASLKKSKRYSLYYGAALAKNNSEAKLLSIFFTNFLNEFPKGKAISKQSVNRYYKLYVEAKHEKLPLFQLNKITEILKVMSILIESEDFLRINSSLDFFHKEKHDEPPLIIQPNFEITVKPFLNLEDSIFLATALEIRQYDLFSRFALTRESFLQAYDKGIKSEAILEKLHELSRKEIPQNVKISLKDWEDDHRKVKLYTGIVLKVSEDKQMLIDKTDYMKPYIREILAPGVYLLDQEQEKLWIEALKELSISPLPASRKIETGENLDRTFDDRFTNDGVEINERKDWIDPEKNQLSQIDSHIDLLLRKLETSGIKGDEKKEIEARIQRKLIIIESQINRGIIRPEITEAKGMNFQGKVRLIESALSNSSDRLELTYYTSTGVNSVLVQPAELLKEEKERTLIGKILPDEELIKIKISKISKVKKIRSSLF